MLIASSCIQQEDLESRVIKEKDSKDHDHRSQYLHDRDRILFSRTFRRLGFKTQVVPSGGITSDHIRSRLTHSLEVMQIASSIAIEVNSTLAKKIDIDLIQAIALGHDFGHTAYGHIGEDVLFEFIFDSHENNFNYLNGKVKHSFQSLKICCFLEKRYKPDFCGLNLTIATLDGILKHSNFVDEKERKLYKEIFVCYQNEFWTDKKNEMSSFIIDEKKEKLNRILFEYISPLTYEGMIVAIADDLAQICHDIEDLRRLGGFEGVEKFYKNTNKIFEVSPKLLPENMKKIYGYFEKALEEMLGNNENKSITKLERSYVDLILGIYIPFTSDMMKRIIEIEPHSREKLLKNKDLGKLKNLKDLQQELNLEFKEIELIEFFEELIKEYHKSLFCLPAVAKWDMKGKELYLELHNKLYKAFHQKNCRENGINLRILDYDKRDDIKKSYYAGKNFESSMQENQQQKIDGIPIKFAVWDYLAGMTDNFIIKKYEELTFKRVELK